MADNAELARQLTALAVERIGNIPLYATAPEALALIQTMLWLIERHRDIPADLLLQVIEDSWVPSARNIVMKAAGIKA